MGMMKRFCEDVSQEMGFRGQINTSVVRVADRRLHATKSTQRETGYTFEVYIVHGLYPGHGDGNGRFMFPISRDGFLIEHSDYQIAKGMRANYRACRRGIWKGYRVTGPKAVVTI